MDKMSFGYNDIFWMEFDHMGSKFCIRIRIDSRHLTTEVYYAYMTNNFQDIEEKGKQLLKANTVHESVNYHNANKGRNTIYSEAKKTLEEVEKMYDIAFSQTLKNIALKVFCQECHSAYVFNKNSDIL